MKKIMVMAVAGLLICVSAQLGYAEDSNECKSACGGVFSACNAKAEALVNDLDVKDAKEVCYNALVSCSGSCPDDDKETSTAPMASGGQAGVN